MKALVYRGPGAKALQERPKPVLIAADDAIVKIVKTTICGTDLHILKGDVPTCAPGRILGHEGIGVVESAGAAVTNFKPGDRVLISCISSCGKCDYCRRGMYSHCTTGGWILGNAHRRHPGRVRPHPARRYQPLSSAAGGGRRRAGDAERHPAHRL